MEKLSMIWSEKFKESLKDISSKIFDKIWEECKILSSERNEKLSFPNWWLIMKHLQKKMSIREIKEATEIEK